MTYDPNASDPQRFRVNLLCACRMDLAYGYGETLEAARTQAVKEFQDHHGKRTKWVEEIPERVSADGTHYEEIT